VNIVWKLAFAAVVLVVSVVAISPTPRTPQRRTCGHLYSLQDRLKWLPIPRASHCCQSGRLVNDLKNVGLAQELYRDAHRRYGITIDELNAEMGSPLQISQGYEFLSDGTNWSVVVPRVESLAGNYLLDVSGEIFFHETRIPSTNDLMLKTRFR
jgi:hypothetical protein